jgi:hypothetical protein
LRCGSPPAPSVAWRSPTARRRDALLERFPIFSPGGWMRPAVFDGPVDTATSAAYVESPQSQPGHRYSRHGTRRRFVPFAAASLLTGGQENRRRSGYEKPKTSCPRVLLFFRRQPPRHRADARDLRVVRADSSAPGDSHHSARGARQPMGFEHPAASVCDRVQKTLCEPRPTICAAPCRSQRSCGSDATNASTCSRTSRGLLMMRSCEPESSTTRPRGANTWNHFSCF